MKSKALFQGSCSVNFLISDIKSIRQGLIISLRCRSPKTPHQPAYWFACFLLRYLGNDVSISRLSSRGWSCLHICLHSRRSICQAHPSNCFWTFLGNDVPPRSGKSLCHLFSHFWRNQCTNLHLNKYTCLFHVAYDFWVFLCRCLRWDKQDDLSALSQTLQIPNWWLNDQFISPCTYVLPRRSSALRDAGWACWWKYPSAYLSYYSITRWSYSACWWT